MRALVIALVFSPTLALAQPTVAVDVNVQVAGEAPSPPGLVAPIAIAPPKPAPARWFAVVGTLGVTSQDHVANDASQAGYGARVEADLFAHDRWRAGVAFGVGSDRRFYDSYDAYDAAALDDTRAVAYLQHASRRGRFEARVGGGLGVVKTDVRRWSSWVPRSENAGSRLDAIVEASAQISVDLVGPIAFGLGTVITRFDQRFDSWTMDEERELHRGIDVSLQSSLRWKL